MAGSRAVQGELGLLGSPWKNLRTAVFRNKVFQA